MLLHIFHAANFGIFFFSYNSEVDEHKSSVVESPDISNIKLTENLSPTNKSTSSSCLDFFFDVLQGTGRDRIIEALSNAWNEDPLLTLKLIFQLRDIRNGKGAIVEFHYCLIWLFQNHPLTLINNLEYISKHGYWKDLSWIIKFLVEDTVSLSTERQKRSHDRLESDMENNSLDEVIRKRVCGIIDKGVWKKYLQNLPNDESRKEAKERFPILSKAIHIEQSKEAKLKKSSAKAQAASKLTTFKANNKHFPELYEKIVSLFASALMCDKEALSKNKTLPTTSLSGKWAPAIGGSIDFHTSLGKNIARSLYLSSHQRLPNESESDFDKKAFIYYRQEYLTPLRAAIGIPERFMSKRKWSELEYERVPSVCMKRNKKIFLEKDKERFGVYLEDVKSGKKKIASGALLPHEIVAQVMNSHQPDELSAVGELQWNSYVENLKKSGLFESALAVCDVSGSMSGKPMEVAIALSLLTAAVSKPPFDSFICSFSATPSLHKINQPTLKEKIAFVQEMDWGMNTDMQVLKLIFRSMNLVI